MAGDEVLAATIGTKADAQGNRSSAIVGFSPGQAALTVRRRDTVQMRFPVEAEGRLMFWRSDCRSPAERYCQHDLFELTGATSVTPVGAANGFAEVDEIVPQPVSVVVNAGYPADGITDGESYLDYAGSNRAWREAAQPFGLARLAGAKDVLKAMAVPGGLLLLAQDADGIALLRKTGERLERLAGVPSATKEMMSLVVGDVAVSADDLVHARHGEACVAHRGSRHAGRPAPDRPEGIVR